MQSLINKALLLAFVAIFHCKVAMACKCTVPAPDAAQYNIFEADLFSEIVNNKSTENVVYSPLSIGSTVALAYIGAEGHTEEEMRKVLKLGGGDKKAVIKRYSQFLHNALNLSTELKNGPQLKIANRMYVDSQLNLSPTFLVIARDYFDAGAEIVNFRNSHEATMIINQWVEQETDNKIKNLLQPDSVDSDTSAVLVNAIYFKGKWLKPFIDYATTKSTFHMNNKEKIEVDTMYADDDFRYVELKELDATALEMPYSNSNISMMLILSNKVEGLEKLETKLKGLDLNMISSKMSLEAVDVFLPKFRIEFDLDLKEPLQKLGLRSMFDKTANFSSLFDSSEQQMISDVKHKAYLDVNEAGSEAAASTYTKITPMMLNLNKKLFRADHPFVFAIRSNSTVYFAGHVTKF